MALRDELIRRITSLPVVRYLDRVSGVSAAAYEVAHAQAVTYMREGLPLHLESGRLTREQLHERR